MNGTVRKRVKKSGRAAWEYVFDAGRDDAGKRQQSSKSGFVTKREAEDGLRRAIAEFELKRDAKAAAQLPTFAEFFQTWMQEHAERKCAPKTIERYRDLGGYANRTSVLIAGKTVAFGTVTIESFTTMHMDLMVNSLLDHGGAKTKQDPDGRPLSPKSVRHIACVVHSCFEKAVKWQLINRNPMDGVELPKIERKEPQILDRGRLNELFTKGQGTRLFPFVVLAASTGARRGELLALTWPDIDTASGIITVSKSLEQTRAGLRVKPPKSGKTRKFAVPAEALAVLADHREEQNRDRELFGPDYMKNELIFCRPDGGFYSPDRVGARVSELMRSAGLEGVSLHSLRHSHASELLSKGVPIPTVAKRLGHANANITLSIYSHALEADEVAAAKVWDDAMADTIAASRPKRMCANVSAKIA